MAYHLFLFLPFASNDEKMSVNCGRILVVIMMMIYFMNVSKQKPFNKCQCLFLPSFACSSWKRLRATSRAKKKKNPKVWKYRQITSYSRMLRLSSLAGLQCSGNLWKLLDNYLCNAAPLKFKLKHRGLKSGHQ